MQIEKMHKTTFIKLCKDHGKKLSECMNYVTKKDGVTWHIDVSKFETIETETTPSVIDKIEETTTTISPYTYSFYNRKYTKE